MIRAHTNSIVTVKGQFEVHDSKVPDVRKFVRVQKRDSAPYLDAKSHSSLS